MFIIRPSIPLTCEDSGIGENVAVVLDVGRTYSVRQSVGTVRDTAQLDV